MLKGIDVSTWNGTNVDWEKAKTEIDFAIIRLGFGFESLDNTAKRNIAELNRLGIPYGVYWFSYAYTVEHAKTEAKSTIKYLKELGAKLSYPVYFDWEYDSRDYAKKHGVNVTKDLLCKMATAYCEEIKAAGYYPGVYANPDYIKNYYGTEIFKKYDLWLAHYVTKTSYEAPIWQYTSSGKVSGVGEKVDMNYCYVDYPAIIRGDQAAENEPKKEATDGTEAPAHYDTAKAGTYKVKADCPGLYFRTGPDSDRKALDLLAAGTVVKSLGHYTGVWLRVETMDSRVGYCHSDYLEKV